MDRKVSDIGSEPWGDRVLTLDEAREVAWLLRQLLTWLSLLPGGFVMAHSIGDLWRYFSHHLTDGADADRLYGEARQRAVEERKARQG